MTGSIDGHRSGDKGFLVCVITGNISQYDVAIFQWLVRLLIFRFSDLNALPR
jgi:hypothetical protein